MQLPTEMNPPTGAGAPPAAEAPGAPPAARRPQDPPRAADGGTSSWSSTCSACSYTSKFSSQRGLEVSASMSQPPTLGRCEGAYLLSRVPSRIKPQSPTAITVYSFSRHFGGFFSFSVLLSLLSPLCFLGSPPRKIKEPAPKSLSPEDMNRDHTRQ